MPIEKAAVDGQSGPKLVELALAVEQAVNAQTACDTTTSRSHPRARRGLAGCAKPQPPCRFRGLPVPEILRALEQVKPELARLLPLCARQCQGWALPGKSCPPRLRRGQRKIAASALQDKALQIDPDQRPFAGHQGDDLELAGRI